MTREEKELLEQLGVKPGADVLYSGLLALARRLLALEERIAALEAREPVSLASIARRFKRTGRMA